MKQMLFVTVVLFLSFSFVANAHMGLKLSNRYSHEQTVTLGNHNLESNLKLELRDIEIGWRQPGPISTTSPRPSRNPGHP